MIVLWKTNAALVPRKRTSQNQWLSSELCQLTTLLPLLFLSKVKTNWYVRMTPHSDRFWNSTYVHIGVYLCKSDLPALETKHRLWLIGTLDTLAWANSGNTPYQRTNVIDAVVVAGVDVCSRVTSSNNKQILITSCKEDYPCVTQPHVWLVHWTRSRLETFTLYICAYSMQQWTLDWLKGHHFICPQIYI